MGRQEHGEGGEYGLKEVDIINISIRENDQAKSGQAYFIRFSGKIDMLGSTSIKLSGEV